MVSTLTQRTHSVQGSPLPVPTEVHTPPQLVLFLLWRLCFMLLQYKSEQNMEPNYVRMWKEGCCTEISELRTHCRITVTSAMTAKVDRGKVQTCVVMPCVNVTLSNRCVASWFQPYPTWPTPLPPGLVTPVGRHRLTDCSSIPFPAQCAQLYSTCKSCSSKLRGRVGFHWLVSLWGITSTSIIDKQTTWCLKSPMALNPTIRFTFLL